MIACHNDDNNEVTPPANVSRAVMIYMAGENNLTSSNNYRFLQNDLTEIIEGSKLLAADQRLFVFVDSLNTNSNEAGMPYIIEVQGGKVLPRKVFTEEFYTSDPAFFHQVLEWMTTNAKASSYGVVLWGHASGWVVSTDTIAQSRTITRAYGEDDGNDIKGGHVTWMNITQMARALQGLPKFKFIFCDCCNMMNAEVGYELRNATDYLIGSPAEIPGEGAPYQKIIPKLFLENDSDLYRSVIDTYYNYYIDGFKDDEDLNGYSVPLSVIDTKQMENLARETRDILGTFMPTAPNSPNLNNIAFYWYYDSAPIMYDMKAFMKANAEGSRYQQWEQAYNKAVPYYRMSMKWMTIYSGLYYSFRSFNQDKSMYGCVSMHIPRNLYAYTSGYFRLNEYSTNMAWNRVMEWSRFGW